MTPSSPTPPTPGRMAQKTRTLVPRPGTPATGQTNGSELKHAFTRQQAEVRRRNREPYRERQYTGTGTSPYTMIPFPDHIVTAKEMGAEGLHTSFDRYVPGTFSGYLDLTLTSLTPLHIGQGQELQAYQGGQLFESFTVRTAGQSYACIPGSSLRGSIKALLQQILGTPLRHLPSPPPGPAPDDSDASETAKIKRKETARVNDLLRSIPDRFKPGTPDFDPALPAIESLFGRVLQTGTQDEPTITSRLSFGHAWCRLGGDVAEHFERVEPLSILGPRTSAWHMRLEKESCDPHLRNGYAIRDPEYNGYESENPRYRGLECYLHRWDAPKDRNDPGTTWARVCQDHRDAPEHRSEAVVTDGATISYYRPLKAGKIFASRMFFHNLSDLELGALMTVLRLGNALGRKSENAQCAHKIGGLRQLGLGSVFIHPELHLLTPGVRYAAESWAGEKDKEGLAGYTDDDGQDFRRKFFMEYGKTRQFKAVMAASCWADRLPYAHTDEMSLKQHKARRFPKDITTLFLRA